MASIEGKRGMPRPRPPYPAESGLWGKPTLINNVETSPTSPLIANGGRWFAASAPSSPRAPRSSRSPAPSANTGLIEVDMGTTCATSSSSIGGGIPDGKAFKAVQTGGPSGGCVPEQHLDIEVDYDSLKTLGTMMGSGGMIVMDETPTWSTSRASSWSSACDESCGKCIPCREGTSGCSRS
jgi:bidirectional [NiFe] hydrogenase diaphorase subunit